MPGRSVRCLSGACTSIRASGSRFGGMGPTGSMRPGPRS